MYQPVDDPGKNYYTFCRYCKKRIDKEDNFCNHCSTKAVVVCRCWVLKKPYNCGWDRCPGRKLLSYAFTSLNSLKTEAALETALWRTRNLR